MNFIKQNDKKWLNQFLFFLQTLQGLVIWCHVRHLKFPLAFKIKFQLSKFFPKKSAQFSLFRIPRFTLYIISLIRSIDWNLSTKQKNQKLKNEINIFKDNLTLKADAAITLWEKLEEKNSNEMDIVYQFASHNLKIICFEFNSRIFSTWLRFCNFSFVVIVVGADAATTIGLWTVWT